MVVQRHLSANRQVGELLIVVVEEPSPRAHVANARATEIVVGEGFFLLAARTSERSVMLERLGVDAERPRTCSPRSFPVITLPAQTSGGISWCAIIERAAAS